jgi:hypothetical protein
MWQKPRALRMRFEATEDFAVDRLAFSWRARFPIVGRLALTVADECRDGYGRLRLSLLGVPLRTQSGHELAVGEAMRYLAELVWAPHAIGLNRELDWRQVDETTIEVTAPVGTMTAVALGVRFVGRSAPLTRRSCGKTFVPRPWGGNFGDFETLRELAFRPRRGVADLPRVASARGTAGPSRAT